MQFGYDRLPGDAADGQRFHACFGASRRLAHCRCAAACAVGGDDGGSDQRVSLAVAMMVVIVAMTLAMVTMMTAIYLASDSHR